MEAGPLVCTLPPAPPAWPALGSEKPHHYPQTPAPGSPSGPPRGQELTFVAPNGKEREDRGPVVSHAAQGQGCAVLEGEWGAAERRTCPGPPQAPSTTV